MPPYSWIHLENVWWILAGGLIIALAIILGRASHIFSFTFKKRSDKTLEQEKHDFAGLVQEYNKAVPVFIWLITIGYFIWAVGYVLFVGTTGL